MQLSNEMYKRLKELAQAQTIGDLIEKGEDVVVDDYAVGNVDDAYWKGAADGKTDLARAILKTLSQ